ncbi:MAG: hypothetical protein DIU69_13370 [Bacillota bacterium]|nr:MAG: hypothetical protein DIU69_13370 [Bacillota bacterium]
MRILMLTATFFTSGQTVHVINLVRGLRRRGHEVDLMITHPGTMEPTTHPYARELQQLGVRVQVIPRYAVVADRVPLPRQKYDLVHAQSSWSFEHARRIASRLGIPLVITCHGLGLEQQPYRPALAAAASLICVGPRIAQSLPSFRKKAVVIGNGVDLELFRPGVRERELTILYAGRVDRWKRAGVLALCQAVEQMPKDVRFWVASNRRLPSQRAQHLGWVTDVHRYMARAHVVVGTGRAIREGLAAGAACLVLGREYHGPVTPEYVGKTRFPDFSGLGGHQGEPTPAALYRDLMQLYRDRSWLQELMAFGRRYATLHLGLDAMVAATIDVYRDAIASHERK